MNFKEFFDKWQKELKIEPLIKVEDIIAKRDCKCQICDGVIQKDEYYTVISKLIQGRGWIINEICLQHPLNELVIK